MTLLFVLFLPCRILNSSLLWKLQPRLLNLHMPSQFFLTGKCEVKESASPHQLIDHVLGSYYHQCTPQTSWITCALLCCSSNRYQGG